MDPARGWSSQPGRPVHAQHPPLHDRYIDLNRAYLETRIVAKDMPNTTFRIHNGGVMPKMIIITMNFVEAGDGMYH